MPEQMQQFRTELTIRKVKVLEKRYNFFDIKVRDLNFRVITYDKKYGLVWNEIITICSI